MQELLQILFLGHILLENAILGHDEYHHGL